MAGIVPDSIVDGPGIRVTLFGQGCPHRCPGCQNPETWDERGGISMTTDDILSAIRSNPLARGVTFSGGEPFLQSEGFAEVAEALKRLGYEVASFTGYTFEELLDGTEAQRRLLGSLDILIDGPYLEAERSLSLMFRGSRNQRILDVPKSLAARTAVRTEQERWVGTENASRE